MILKKEGQRIAGLTLAVSLAFGGAACAADGKTSPHTRADSSGSAATTSVQTETKFKGEIKTIDETLKRRMRYSYREGCPVPIENLRYLSVSYWDFDGKINQGELVVNQDVADDMVKTMKVIFDAKFPIERMELVDNFKGDDNASMEANNTSAFNCRKKTGNPNSWSEHSYGRAIDINPVQNPYITGSTVLPPEGDSYTDRSKIRKGMIVDHDNVVTAFADIGWKWGGNWKDPIDYQHFSRSGN